MRAHAAALAAHACALQRVTRAPRCCDLRVSPDPPSKESKRALLISSSFLLRPGSLKPRPFCLTACAARDLYAVCA